jgi:hypothetical protein
MKRSGTITFTAKGYSMYPAICNMEKVTLVKVDFSELQIGDIVLGITIDGPLLHRIIEKHDSAEDAYVIIKGDAAASGRHKVYSEDIAGRVARIHKRHTRRVKNIIMRRLMKNHRRK